MASLLVCLLSAGFLAPPQPLLARPTPEQIAWQDMELEMFVALDPCAWQNREYDDHSTPLAQINPSKLDTDQWVRVAKAMGAKQILFVAKHVGGFCWWQTKTSNYGVKETSWRDGRGDVMADLAKSCRKGRIKLAVYLSPADTVHGASTGGRCETPAAQKAYDRTYRQQLTELLTRYGKISEVWFDGSNVVEVGDILRKHAPRAMVFQGPHATLRWVGNEDGYAPYPCWNSLRSADAKTGVATAEQSHPDGDAWMPCEVDTVNVNPHCWFWNSLPSRRLRSLDELMDCYYRSVGHGAVLLLNQTPDTTGLIPEPDARRAAEFGTEVKRRFGKLLVRTKRLEVGFRKPTFVDQVVVMEDIRHGERVREYMIEGLGDLGWRELAHGSAIGHKRIERFAATKVARVRLRFLQSAAPPIIRRLEVYGVGSTPPENDKPTGRG